MVELRSSLVLLGIVQRVLILTGYPVVGVALTFTGWESTVLTTPYRCLVFAIAVLLIFGSFLSRKAGRVDGLIVVFFGLYATRLIHDWLFAELQGADQALLFFGVVTVVPVLASMRSGANLVADDLLAKCIMPVASSVMILAATANLLGMAHNPWAEYGISVGRLGFEALNPISLGHVAGLSLICCTYLFLHGRRTTLFRAILVGYGALSAVTIIMANSRGPIVAVACALVWQLTTHYKRAIFLTPVLLGVPLYMSLDHALLKNVIARFTADDSVDLSGMERLNIQEAAIQAFLEHPFLGAHYMDTSFGTGAYPHNMLIETGMALGILGLSVMIILFMRAASRVWHFYNVQHPLIAMILIQQAVAMQLSGALWATDAFFMVLGMCLTATTSVKQFAPTPNTFHRRI